MNFLEFCFLSRPQIQVPVNTIHSQTFNRAGVVVQWVRHSTWQCDYSTSSLLLKHQRRYLNDGLGTWILCHLHGKPRWSSCSLCVEQWSVSPLSPHGALFKSHLHPPKTPGKARVHSCFSNVRNPAEAPASDWLSPGCYFRGANPQTEDLHRWLSFFERNRHGLTLWPNGVSHRRTESPICFKSRLFHFQATSLLTLLRR